MPYNRDEVIASVTDFYNFLITHLHFQPSELKTPPPTGWPQVNQERLAFLGKSDQVIDLAASLPYLPPGKQEKHIYDHTVCVDYTHESIDRKQEDPELVITSHFEPEHELVDACPYHKFKERHEDVIVLGLPERGDNGCYIFLDTLDGEVVTWDVMETTCVSFDSAREFFDQLRQWFEEIKLFPVPTEVAFLVGDHFDSVKNVIRSFGWPPAQEDGSGWQREECLKEVKKMIDELR